MEHVALITGAGRGIGAAIAEYLGARGVAVLVAARTTKDCESVAGKIVAAGGRARALELDVTDSESIRAAVDVAADFGSVDWLVNNAGIAESAPIFGGDALYQKHLDVNFHGPRRMVEAFAPAMIGHGYGRVVTIASSAAMYGYAYVAAYVASKHAVLGYTRSAALELAKKGLTFNAVCPHYVDSPMTDESVKRIVEKTGRSAEDTAQFFANQNPGGRLVQPLEIAKAVHALCEGQDNGQVIELDGSDE